MVNQGCPRAPSSFSSAGLRSPSHPLISDYASVIGHAVYGGFFAFAMFASSGCQLNASSASSHPARTWVREPVFAILVPRGGDPAACT